MISQCLKIVLNDCGFDIEEEFRDYCKMGSQKSKFSRYTEWENGFVKKHKNLHPDNEIEKIHRYLHKYVRECQYSNDLFAYIMSPLAISLYALVCTYGICEELTLYERLLSIVAISIIIAWILIAELNRRKTLIAFGEDCIELLLDGKCEGPNHNDD